MEQNTATTTASTPAAPRTDRLEVVKELTRGSIGVVHKARNPQQDRLTAVRQFQVPQWLDDLNELLQRIMAEARGASSLDHPNVAKLYTCGYKDFNVFMTFEFVEGQTLKELMAGRTPELSEALSIARQLCAALDHAHGKGVFHHFLNPYNIKVLADGTVKVLDFGLLRDKNLMSQTPAKKLENEPYLSPEQVKNRLPDRAANMFTLGAILYEIYTTRSPFAGKHLGEVDRAITDTMPHALNVANGRVPEAISRVVMKALAKNSAERYQSGEQLMAALEQAMREPRTMSSAAAKPATGKFPAYETGSYNFNKPATGKFPAYQEPNGNGNGKVNGNGNVNGNTTGTLNVRPATARTPAQGTTRVNVPLPPTAVRRSAKTAHQWKIVGGIVAVVLVAAALAMMLQRRAPELPADSGTVQTTPSTSTTLPFSAKAEPAETVPEQKDVTRSTPARGSRSTARVPQLVTEPAPTRVSDGQLSITSMPQGATVEIEGRSGQWQTPQIIGPLTPGNYKVTVSKPGYAPETRIVQVIAGNRAGVDLKLNAVKGWITVGGTPVGASVLVDGKDTGRVTPVELMLDPATHSIALHKPGYLDSSTEIRLAAGQSVGYSPTMMVAGRTDNIRIVGGGVGKMFNNGSQDGLARIEIKSEPKGARVIVNGTPLQKTTPVEIQVEAGNYDITLQKDGFQPIHESAIVGVEDRVKIDRTLTR
jgi:serine/threonine protein kinase